MKSYLQKILWFWKHTDFYLRILFLVGVVVSIGLAIRGLTTGVIFSYDQARDAIQAYNIWHNHHLEILGPSTDIIGVFHGVLWYYLLAFVYAIVRRPEFVAAAFCIFLFLTTPFVGMLAQELFADTSITAISMLFYLLSPLFQTSSRWLSNPIPSFLAAPLLLFFWWSFAKLQRVRTAFIIGICYGVIIQAEFGLLLLLVTVPLYYIFLPLKMRFKEIGALCLGLLLSLSTFIVADIKFHGQTMKGIIAYLEKGAPHLSLWAKFSLIWIRIAEFFRVSFFNFPEILIGVIFLIILIMAIVYFREYRKQLTFLLLWVCSIFLFLLSGTGIATSAFLFFPFLSAFLILGSFTIVKICKNPVIIMVVILAVAGGQIGKTYAYITSNTSPLPAQQGASLNLEKQILDYTYQAAQKQPFTIVTITNPLYIDTTWAYLYSTYGFNTYGYVPNYGGRGQTGIFGENLLPEIPFATKIRYLLFEPLDGIPTIYITKITYEEDKVSDIMETKHIGRYVIQKRILHHNKPLPPVPLELQGKPILHE